MDELPYMVTFVQVVKAGSYAAAARQLDSSVSALSKHVTRLEKVLGARLLNRTTRNISLTEAGSVYYERCVRILEAMEEARDAIPSSKSEPRGHLRVTAPVVFTNLFIVPLLPEFQARYPDITLAIQPTDARVDLAEEGLDLGIRITASPPPNMIGRRIGKGYSLVCCASPTYLKKHGKPEKPEDLAAHQCFAFAISQGEWRFRKDGQVQPVKVSSKLNVNNGEAMLKMALMDMGITALVPFIVREHITAGRLQPILEGYLMEPVMDIYAIYLPHRYIPAKLRVFVDFLAEKLKALN